MTTTVFHIEGWMALTNCSEPQALAAASGWLHWGVEGHGANAHHISDFLHEEELDFGYYFVLDEDGVVIDEGWVGTQSQAWDRRQDLQDLHVQEPCLSCLHYCCERCGAPRYELWEQFE